MKATTKRHVRQSARFGVLVCGCQAALQLAGLHGMEPWALGYAVGFGHWVGQQREAERNLEAIFARFAKAAVEPIRLYMGRPVVLWGGKPTDTVQFGSKADQDRERARRAFTAAVRDGNLRPTILPE